MDITLSQLIVALLLFGATASLALVWALKHTADGCEDEKGFHCDTGGDKAEAAQDLSAEIRTRNFRSS